MSILDKFIHYYHEQIFSNSKKKQILSPSVNKYFIIDYANIIHILYEKYKDDDLVFTKFNHFLHKYSKTNIIFIVSKPVIIDEKQLNASNLKCLKNVYIFDIEYKAVSSNIDDIITHFLCVVVFVGLIRLKINPLKKIVFVSNDTQNFQKSLFEFTKDEKREKITVNDVRITEITFHRRHKTGMKKFLKEYMTRDKKTNATLKCSIGRMVGVIQAPDFTYHDLNKLQKKITNKCMQHSRKNGKLKKYFYLYVYIKYIQYYLNNDLYGSMSKEKIISLFH